MNRKIVGEVILGIAVLTLIVSNVVLATKLVALREEVPTLSARIAGEISRTQATIFPVPTLQVLTPDFGTIGTKVIVHGSGFSATGNNVYFSNTVTYNIPSYDGVNLAFTVPAYNITPGLYPVSVENAGGRTTSLNFFVTDTIKISSRVKITSLKPNSGMTGVQVTINGSGFTSTGNTVTFGYNKINGIKSTGKTMKFIVPAYLVYPCLKGQPCPTQNARPTMPGSYPVYVTNSRGSSNSALFTVTSGPSPSTLP